MPEPLGCETRIGGFGGERAFFDWLKRADIELVVDATHPFAERITARSARVCAEIGMPFLSLTRPAWSVDRALGRIEIPSGVYARELIDAGACVFLATGRQTLADFTNLSDCTVYCRQIDPPEKPFPFENGEFVIGRPPFTVEEEISLFKRLKIDVLIVKNAGGAASASKLHAAETLGINVLLIKRPALPNCPVVGTVEEALEWVKLHAPH